MSNAKRDRLRNEWAEKYSSPGEFEESGQQEAWTNGWNARQEEIDKLRAEVWSEAALKFRRAKCMDGLLASGKRYTLDDVIEYCELKAIEALEGAE